MICLSAYGLSSPFRPQTNLKFPFAFDADESPQMFKGKLDMSLLSKRLVNIAASTLALSLVSASANAQGTWYTDKALWESLVTNVSTAEYNSGPDSDFLPWEENGITANSPDIWNYGGSFLSVEFALSRVSFTFEGNAFGGLFATNSPFGGNLRFIVDGSQSNDLGVTSRSSGYTFLGYISNSSSNINVQVRSTNLLAPIAVDSFSRANGTNTSNPGSNVAPEPGSFALALTGGAALLGICVRRRRNAG